ncbi:MAG: hypothetical protein ACXACI_10670 [Candidatus Hodarchaeales archaeon]|jgi:hypothetical protein
MELLFPSPGKLSKGVSIATQEIIESFHKQQMKSLAVIRSTTSGMKKATLVRELYDFHKNLITTLVNEIREQNNIETTVHLSRIAAENDLRAMTKIEVPILVGALVAFFQSPDNWTRKVMGILWFLESIKWIDDISGIKGSGLYELLRKGVLGMLLSKFEVQMSVASLPNLYFYLIQHSREKTLPFIDLNSITEYFEIQYHRVKIRIVAEFKDGLADIFRKQLGFLTVMEMIGLSRKSITNEELGIIIKDDPNLFAKMSEEEGKDAAYKWRAEQIGKVMSYHLYKWYIDSPLTEAAIGDLNYLVLVGNIEDELHFQIVDLIKQRTLDSLIIIARQAKGKELRASSYHNIARNLNQNHVDNLAEQFNEFLWVIANNQGKKTKFTLNTIDIDFRYLFYNTGFNNRSNGSPWKWNYQFDTGKSNSWAPLSYPLWRTVLGHKMGSAIAEDGKFLVAKGLTQSNLSKRGVRYWQPTTKNSGNVYPISSIELGIIERINQTLRKLPNKSPGPAYYGRVIRIWAKKEIQALEKYVPNIRIGIQDFTGGFSIIMNDYGAMVTDDGRSITDVWKDLLKDVQKKTQPINNDSFNSRAFNQIKLWLKVFNKQYVEGMSDEQFFSHLLEIGWRFGIRKAMRGSGSKLSKNLIQIIDDAHGVMQEWHLWQELQLSNAADEIINRTETPLNKQFNFILDSIHIYRHNSSSTAVIAGIQDKIIKNVDDIVEITAKEYNVVHDIRQINQFLTHLWHELRGKNTARKIRLGEVEIENTASWTKRFKSALTSEQMKILKSIETLFTNPKQLKIRSVLIYGILRMGVPIVKETKDKNKKITDFSIGILVWKPTID